MSCPVLESLTVAVAALEALPVPVGLGADGVLAEQVPAVAAAIARLQRDLAVRMAAWERADPKASDVRGSLQQAGVDPQRARLLRHLGRFADEHRDVALAWRSGGIRLDQVDALRLGARGVPGGKHRELVSSVLPLLAGLDHKESRVLIAYAVDQLAPGDPDHEEKSDHAARRLAWSRVPGGGISFAGHLPAAEGAAFTAAIHALVESLRVAGDGLTAGQRRADALAALVATATAHGLPTGGGLPAAMTLTVSLTEATRVALRDPSRLATRVDLRPRSRSTLDGQSAGDATVRFGLCCAAITPILTDDPGPLHRRYEVPDPPDSDPCAADPAGASRRSDRADRRIQVDSGAPPDPSGGHPRALGSLLDRIANTPVQPLAVGRSVRLATPAQRQALRVRDGGCAIPGCGIDSAYTQPHHVVGWAVGGATDLDSMVSLCWVHHRMTELGRFRFISRMPGEPQPAGSLEHQQWWIIPPTAVRS